MARREFRDGTLWSGQLARYATVMFDLRNRAAVATPLRKQRAGISLIEKSSLENHQLYSAIYTPLPKTPSVLLTLLFLFRSLLNHSILLHQTACTRPQQLAIPLHTISASPAWIGERRHFRNTTSSPLRHNAGEHPRLAVVQAQTAERQIGRGWLLLRNWRYSSFVGLRGRWE